MACNFGKENFTRVNAALPSVLIHNMSICYFIYFPFWFEGTTLIVPVAGYFTVSSPEPKAHR